MRPLRRRGRFADAAASHSAPAWIVTTFRTLALTAALAAVPGAAHAQSGPAARPVLSLSAGVAQFDLAGTGNTPTVALRLERAVAARWLLAEVGAAVLRPREQTGTRQTYAVPEVQLQAQLPTALIRARRAGEPRDGRWGRRPAQACMYFSNTWLKSRRVWWSSTAVFIASSTAR